MEEVLHVMTHDDVMFFTQDGVARSLKAYQIPEGSRTAQGSAITQVSSLYPCSKIVAYCKCAEIMLWFAGSQKSLRCCTLQRRILLFAQN